MGPDPNYPKDAREFFMTELSRIVLYIVNCEPESEQNTRISTSYTINLIIHFLDNNLSFHSI